MKRSGCRNPPATNASNSLNARTAAVRPRYVRAPFAVANASVPPAASDYSPLLCLRRALRVSRTGMPELATSP